VKQRGFGIAGIAPVAEHGESRYGSPEGKRVRSRVKSISEIGRSGKANRRGEGTIYDYPGPKKDPQKHIGKGTMRKGGVTEASRERKV
jgi:hypothetical protein